MAAVRGKRINDYLPSEPAKPLRFVWARHFLQQEVCVTKSIHQEVTIKASAKKVFDALTDAKQFSAFSMPCLNCHVRLLPHCKDS